MNRSRCTTACAVLLLRAPLGTTTLPRAPIAGQRNTMSEPRELRRQEDEHARLIRRTQASSTAGRRSCCQMRSTRQPPFRRRRFTFRSLLLFWASLSAQKRLFVLGILAWSGQPCQKQPSTKTANRCCRKTKSGRPGRRWLRRQPVIECLRKISINRSSVERFPAARTRDITAERFSGP